MSSVKLTELEISGIAIPARADDTVSVRISPESSAADMRRTVNGDLKNIAREVFRKYAISVSGTGINLPSIAGIWQGQYVEILPPDPISLKPRPGGLVVGWNRAAVAVHGRTLDGRRVEPISQPPSPLPLFEEVSKPRVAALRTPWEVTFPEAVAIVFVRPVIACLVTNWGTDSEDASKEVSWSIELAEA